MAKKNELPSREQVEQDVKNFTSDIPEERKLFPKTKMSIDWMDAYVAYNHPDKVEEWITACLKFEAKKQDYKAEDGTRTREMRDVKAVRDYFIATFFQDKTKEAIEAQKEKEKEERRKRKEEKEARKAMTAEEKLRDKFKQLINS